MRYFVGLLVTFGLVILLFVILLSGGGGKKVPKTQAPLISYATTNAVARFTTDGPINDSQDHEQIQITVGQYAVVYEEMKGYDGHVVNRKVYHNSTNGYNAFLHALAVAGFTEGNNDPKMSDDGGYCPLGDRYVFELQQNGSDIERYWTTSCGSPKTYYGDTDLTVQLFQAQVPNYDVLTQNIQL